jgi:putative transposase
MLNLGPEVLDSILKDYKNPEDLMGENGILKQLTKALVERCLNAEIEYQLKSEPELAEAETCRENSKNRRNGYSKKTIKGSFGEAEIAIPRDRENVYEPQLVPKHQTRFDGFDQKVIALYSRGLSTHDIAAMLEDLYGVSLSAGMISEITAQVVSELQAWQNRSLDSVYPIMWLDAIMVPVRQEGKVIKTQNESAKFWLSVLTDLQNRGVKDIFIACCDGLTGFPAAIESLFPKTQVQLCIVHMVRNSLKYVSYKDRRAVAADLKTIYSSATEAGAEQALMQFAQTWDKQYPSISKSWLAHWAQITPFFAFPSDIRKAIYTTNAIESVNMTLRKVLRNHRNFPTDESAIKVIFLALQNISKKWTMPIRDWKRALNCFAIHFEGRLPD